MDTKKFILLTMLLAVMFSCGSGDRGELVGTKGKNWHSEKPFGMTLIPGGSFIMGKSDDDLAGVNDAPTKTATVRAFYMDETEITNSEYRSFVHWVRDSIIRRKLAIMADDIGKIPDDGGIGEYAFKDADTADLSVYEKYMKNTYPAELELEHENSKNDKSASYLDLQLDVLNGEIVTSLYDKRVDFPFKIVNFPDLSGNIPHDRFYGVFIAQTLRYAKACAKYTDFITRTLMLKIQLIKQNFHAKVLDRKLHRWHKRSDKAAVMDKFGHDMKKIISDLQSLPHTHGTKQKNKKQNPENKNKKSTTRIKSKTNLSTSRADRASAG